jgi:hypothetical protein
VGRGSRLRPLRIDDEDEARAAHAELAEDAGTPIERYWIA